MLTYALGMVKYPPGLPKMDKDWARALVVRHAHDRLLRLVDILELPDLDTAPRMLDQRLSAPDKGRPAPTVLLIGGVPPEQAEALAARHDMAHELVQLRGRRRA